MDRVTISLDSLLRHRFEEMTRRDGLDKVLAGIRAAEEAGLLPVKINCVVIAGTNEDEVVEFARWSREHGHVVRFIEYMPLDAQHAWERAKVWPSARILEAIDAAFPLAAQGPDAEPATSYGFADGAPGGIGIIASVTRPFCDDCNRLRTTAEGQVRACLFALEETDLRGPMRAGASDDELEAADPNERLAQVVGAPDQPSGLRPARALDVGDRRLGRPQARRRTRRHSRRIASPAKNQPTAPATSAKTEKNTIPNPRVAWMNPGVVLKAASSSPRVAIATTTPHTQSAATTRNRRPRAVENPSSQSCAAVAWLRRRRRVR